jgi:hypothetical protein
MNLAHKLVVEPLKDQCLNFLLTHAAGNPVKAMSLAETFSEENLFQESSRFVLDNPEGWCDIVCLSQGTQLKLERKCLFPSTFPFLLLTLPRRTWFLERILKLGSTNIAREYQCVRNFPNHFRALSWKNAVCYMSRTCRLRQAARGEMETRLPIRNAFRSMPTIHCLAFPTNARN